MENRDKSMDRIEDSKRLMRDLEAAPRAGSCWLSLHWGSRGLREGARKDEAGTWTHPGSAMETPGSQIFSDGRDWRGSVFLPVLICLWLPFMELLT